MHRRLLYFGNEANETQTPRANIEQKKLKGTWKSDLSLAAREINNRNTQRKGVHRIMKVVRFEPDMSAHLMLSEI